MNPRVTGSSRRPTATRPSARAGTGRSNQKERTRTAIVGAAREAITTGGEITMPDVARRALVSEATAYRYFPDLASLLRAALAASWDSPEHAMAPVAHSDDPVERIGFATEVLLREVLAYQAAVRAMLAAAVTRPAAVQRPGRRFGLIDEALRPLEGTMAVQQPARFAQLRRGLAVVVSAETLFTLTDLCGLTPELAIASAIETARSLTAAAIRPVPR
ncbi:MAG: TetR/AcrR family transcriptional regulator [Streptosporangiaceae bacterium]